VAGQVLCPGLNPTLVGNAICFNADDFETGYELWRLDETV